MYTVKPVHYGEYSFRIIFILVMDTYTTIPTAPSPDEIDDTEIYQPNNLLGQTNLPNYPGQQNGDFVYQSNPLNNRTTPNVIYVPANTSATHSSDFRNCDDVITIIITIIVMGIGLGIWSWAW